MKRFLLVAVSIICSGMYAQDVDSIMDNISEAKEFRTIATFKSPRLVLLQTNETQKAHDLAFWVGHRFGDIGGEFGGSNTLYGLDVASDLYLGFDYGVTDALTVGIGRSKFNEAYSALIKYRLLWQDENMPISVTLFEQSSWITRKPFSNNEFDSEGDRISHFFQAIIARKFSPGVSVMVNPGFLIRPEAQRQDFEDSDNLFALGIGGRFKIFKRISIITDYTFVNGLSRPDDLQTDYSNPFGVGVEIETGGHVFALNFQNSQYITANNFIPNTTKSWSDGGVRFGFMISRNFRLGSKK
ncbi:DUF5777 family beta-barrel protein [Christiangramia forsetii]|uniref:DUF5777 domain-containing protein n=2 Tax=Christiangramia forsetii TaxID=411153 RepID=A0LXH7_CHRFK|nr:DUF5777 family beta-barrel protein [Christiangramia forsetii]GGG36788.1 hypothetical protein GCM10011532_20610 [Christiangramia forsetii]CAL65072.1 conserved hypothetical protein [Christiangramia forsetii KT0803]